MKKVWSSEELELIKNQSYSVKELCIMLNVKPGTIRNLRRFNSRDWTQVELNLIKNVSYSARELSVMLNAQVGTIRNLRIKLNVKPSQSAAMSKTRPNRVKDEVRQCIGKECLNSFVVKPAMKKKYCSHSCQQRTENVAAKGIGSRSIRNPKIKEYTKYARKVHGLSHKVYEQNKNVINPNNYRRTLCGVEGGWQLDHIIPIKECFEKGISAEEASDINNLRMLPWRNNLMRNFE